MKNIIHVEREKNKKASLILFLFIFSMLFSFEIAGFKMRYIVIAFWLFFSLINTKKIYINAKLMLFPIVLLCIILYSFIIVAIYDTNNSFEILRCTRAVITYVLILLFLSSGKYSNNQIIYVLSLVLLSNAVCIILGVAFPLIKEIVMPISQYSKEFMSLRSSGFLSGFDDSGYLCNVGLIITFVSNTFYKKKIVNIYALIFIVAVVFTSRFNILCMVFILLVVFLFHLKKANFMGILDIGKYVFAISIFACIVWILTTNVSMNWRNYLVSEYPILNIFYDLMGTSYTDYGVYTSVISRHASIAELHLGNIIFGSGVKKTTSDIGYIKTIYSIGMIGIAVQVSTYVKSIINIYKIKKLNTENLLIQIITSTFIMSVILMFFMETKISFVFSSTTFEMLSIMYITCVISSIKDD